jgi:hypothetical protein
LTLKLGAARVPLSRLDDGDHDVANLFSRLDIPVGRNDRVVDERGGVAVSVILKITVLLDPLVRYDPAIVISTALLIFSRAGGASR